MQRLWQLSVPATSTVSAQDAKHALARLLSVHSNDKTQGSCMHDAQGSSAQTDHSCRPVCTHYC